MALNLSDELYTNIVNDLDLNSGNYFASVLSF